MCVGNVVTGSGGVGATGCRKTMANRQVVQPTTRVKSVCVCVVCVN